MQVSGRAGRTSQGLVVLQTYVPEHFAVRMAVENNYKGFYDEELKNRNEVTYPPFTNLIDLKFSSTAKNDVIKAAAESADVIKGIIKKKDIKVTLLGPSPSTIALINKRYRHHILLKGQSRASLNKLIKLFNSTYKRNKKVRLSIDVDPYSLL
jgi:primosomal protein N' (replication factor Y)